MPYPWNPGRGSWGSAVSSCVGSNFTEHEYWQSQCSIFIFYRVSNLQFVMHWKRVTLTCMGPYDPFGPFKYADICWYWVAQVLDSASVRIARLLLQRQLANFKHVLRWSVDEGTKYPWGDDDTDNKPIVCAHVMNSTRLSLRSLLIMSRKQFSRPTASSLW